jgi:hypothetical protein
MIDTVRCWPKLNPEDIIVIIIIIIFINIVHGGQNIMAKQMDKMAYSAFC